MIFIQIWKLIYFKHNITPRPPPLSLSQYQKLVFNVNRLLDHVVEMTPAILTQCRLMMSRGIDPQPGEEPYIIFRELFRRVVPAPDFGNLPNPEYWKKEKTKKKFTGPKKPSIVHSFNDDRWGNFYDEYNNSEEKKRKAEEEKRNAAKEKKALVRQNKENKLRMTQQKRDERQREREQRTAERKRIAEEKKENKKTERKQKKSEESQIDQLDNLTNVQERMTPTTTVSSSSPNTYNIHTWTHTRTHPHTNTCTHTHTRITVLIY